MPAGGIISEVGRSSKAFNHFSAAIPCRAFRDLGSKLGSFALECLEIIVTWDSSAAVYISCGEGQQCFQSTSSMPANMSKKALKIH